MMTWHARPPALAAADARPLIEIQTLLTLNQGRLRTRTLFRLQAGRSPIADLQLKVDPNAKVVAVSGKNLAQWKESAGEKSKMMFVVRNNLKQFRPAGSDHLSESNADRRISEKSFSYAEWQ